MKVILLNTKYKKLFLIALLLLGVFFSTYKLTESPGVWFDEGVFIQTAMNLTVAGEQGMQVEPGMVMNTAKFMTTGFPLIYPLSFSFKYFGIGLLQARMVMVVFLVALLWMSYLLVREMFGFRAAVFSSLLLVSFPVLYGNGKNVLGEVPGLFFLILFLFFVYKIEKTKFKTKIYYVLAGIAAGLCVATKPIFLILLPALLISILFFRKIIYTQWKLFLTAICSFLIPIAIWLVPLFQESDSLTDLINFYANVQGVSNFFQTITENFFKFFTEIGPGYLFVLSLVWTASVILRIKAKKAVSLTESISFCFVWLMMAAYLFTVGFYRYFFPANVVALLYFPAALFICLNYLKDRWMCFQKIKINFVVSLLMVMMLGIHLYQLGFNSWVATYYNSTRTTVLINYFNNFDPSISTFFYNTPEAVIFLLNDNYYQYAALTPTALVGEEQLEKINLGIPDQIIITRKFLEDSKADFSLYQPKDEVDRYIILEKVNKSDQ